MSVVVCYIYYAICNFLMKILMFDVWKKKKDDTDDAGGRRKLRDVSIYYQWQLPTIIGWRSNCTWMVSQLYVTSL